MQSISGGVSSLNKATIISNTSSGDYYSSSIYQTQQPTVPGMYVCMYVATLKWLIVIAGVNSVSDQIILTSFKKSEESLIECNAGVKNNKSNEDNREDEDLANYGTDL